MSTSFSSVWAISSTGFAWLGLRAFGSSSVGPLRLASFVRAQPHLLTFQRSRHQRLSEPSCHSECELGETLNVSRRGSVENLFELVRAVLTSKVWDDMGLKSKCWNIVTVQVFVFSHVVHQRDPRNACSTFPSVLEFKTNVLISAHISEGTYVRLRQLKNVHQRDPRYVCSTFPSVLEFKTNILVSAHISEGTCVYVSWKTSHTHNGVTTTRVLGQEICRVVPAARSTGKSKHTTPRRGHTRPWMITQGET